MKHCKFHIFTHNKNLQLQNDFIFFDTETERIEDKEIFKLGWLIYYNRKTKEYQEYFFDKKNDFFNYVLNKMKKINHIFLFAHNTDFDIKVLGGLNKLIKNGFEISSFYIEGCRYVVRLQKKNKEIEILDSMNYVPLSLKSIGKSIGFNKMEIDFKNCSYEYLKEYCLNDTRIIYKFIDKLLDFLNEYNLSKLKPTVSSLSLNIFRHKFYNKKENPIYIHNWHKAVELERMSYKGGITDCFKIGEYKEQQYKLDVNSMYPFQMKNFPMPVKLLYYRDSSSCKKSIMFEKYNKFKKDKLIIARCKIFLPKEYAYILTKATINKEKKSIFLCGEFINTLTSPELDFVEKFGKIIEIYNIAIYEKSIIFDKFVNFFNEQKIKFEKENDIANRLFCKTILNSLYGKFGQTSKVYLPILNKNYKYSSKYIIDSVNDDNYIEMTLGNKTFEVEDTGNNAYDTFVAIPSFVTAYARMNLVYYILKAKRENVYYVDTDSLIVNNEGYNNLKNDINKTELGKLKIEEISRYGKYYRPKYYIFGNEEKCKGVKKNHIKISEDDNKLVIKQEQFKRFNSSLRNNDFENQTVIEIIKEINKNYDKGLVNNIGEVIPYEIKI